MSDEAPRKLSVEDYEKVKVELASLSQKYSDQIDVVAKETYVLSAIRSQISLCLEIIEIYEESLNE
jgi:hypothetical protein